MADLDASDAERIGKTLAERGARRAARRARRRARRAPDSSADCAPARHIAKRDRRPDKWSRRRARSRHRSPSVIALARARRAWNRDLDPTQRAASNNTPKPPDRQHAEHEQHNVKDETQIDAIDLRRAQAANAPSPRRSAGRKSTSASSSPGTADRAAARRSRSIAEPAPATMNTLHTGATDEQGERIALALAIMRIERVPIDHAAERHESARRSARRPASQIGRPRRNSADPDPAKRPARSP